MNNTEVTTKTAFIGWFKGIRATDERRD